MDSDSDSDDSGLIQFNTWAAAIIKAREKEREALGEKEKEKERPKEKEKERPKEKEKERPKEKEKERPKEKEKERPKERPNEKEKEKEKEKEAIWEDDEEEEEEEVKGGKKKRRSVFMSDLRGSVYLKSDFPTDSLPLALREFPIYGVRDVDLGGQEGDLWMSSYVVKKLVDIEFGLSAKTIDNYFRNNSSHGQIGYVVNSKRIPVKEEAHTRLSPSHKYLLIKLHFLKEWWEKSYTMNRIIQKTGKNTWPIQDEEEISDLSGNEDF